MKIYYCSQRSKEWYALRCGKLTASNFHILLGNSQTMHAYLIEKAFERITKKCVTHRWWTEDIQRGIDLEPTACKEYERATGNTVKHVGFIEYNEFMGASPDGLIDNDGGLETKCPNEKNFWEIARTRKVAPAHYTQCQYNMLVAERDWWDYVNYSTMEEPVITKIYRDDKYIKMLTERAKRANDMIERYKKQLYFTVQPKTIKYKRMGVLSGWRYAAAV